MAVTTYVRLLDISGRRHNSEYYDIYSFYELPSLWLSKIHKFKFGIKLHSQCLFSVVSYFRVLHRARRHDVHHRRAGHPKLLHRRSNRGEVERVRHQATGEADLVQRTPSLHWSARVTLEPLLSLQGWGHVPPGY